MALLDEVQHTLNNYAKMRETYRNAAFQKMPTTLDLTSLNAAEMEEELAFKHLMRLMYPDSLSTWAVEIGALVQFRRFHQAITICNEALAYFPEAIDQLFFRPYRLQAACGATLYKIEDEQYVAFILEDIHTLWQEPDDTYEFPKSRKANLLKMLFPVLGNTHIPILETLAQDEMFPSIVRQAFEAKIAQLCALDEALKAL